MRMLSLRVFVLVQALALLALPQSVTAGAAQLIYLMRSMIPHQSAGSRHR